MEILILFGAPFSGKGTQGEILAQKTGYLHVSTGDILRTQRKMHTSLGLKAESYIRQGHLVPDDLLDELIEDEIIKCKQGKGIILDGYPRTINQAYTLHLLAQKHGVAIRRVLFLDVPHEVLIARGIHRGKTSDRIDDKDPDVMNKRIEIYHSETKPVGKYYVDRNLSVTISGIGEVEEVAERILASI